MDTPARIKAWREVKEMTRQELADEVGVTVAAVYQWEGSGGHITSPSVAHLEKIVSALKITMGEFYGRVPRTRKAAS